MFSICFVFVLFKRGSDSLAARVHDARELSATLRSCYCCCSSLEFNTSICDSPVDVYNRHLYSGLEREAEGERPSECTFFLLFVGHITSHPTEKGKFPKPKIKCVVACRFASQPHELNAAVSVCLMYASC